MMVHRQARHRDFEGDAETRQHEQKEPNAFVSENETIALRPRQRKRDNRVATATGLSMETSDSESQTPDGAMRHRSRQCP